MKLQYTFKNLPASLTVIQYCEQRFAKLEKYELKPGTIQLRFSSHRFAYKVEVQFQGPDVSCKAQCTDKDFYTAVDQAVNKLVRQLAKRKDKVQTHKNIVRSKEGKISRLNEYLESEEAEVLKRTG